MTFIPHIVAIPARDEADHVYGCIQALAGQAQQVLLLVNNSTDGTGEVAALAAATFGVRLTVSAQHFDAGQCSAGHARKVAMDQAAAMVPDGVLLTTDADSRVSADWISRNLRYIEAGADAVAGRAVIDPIDAAAIPERLHEDDARECTLGALLDEIASVLDPDPADPWPRHTEHSGASICVSANAFRRVGGIPDVPLGEDRGFFTALRRIDGVIRHATDVTVTVSGRIEGRATGGMADTIRRRLAAPDAFLDDALEPVGVAVRRARLRVRARVLWVTPDDPALLDGLSHDLGMSPADLWSTLTAPFFGAAWANLEARSAVLARERVPAGDVERQIALAQDVLASLRVRQVRRRDPSDRFQRAGVQWA